MSSLFFCASIPAPGQRVVLDDAESKHVSGSRRLRVPQRIAIFDGDGTIAQAEIQEVDTRTHRVCLEILSRARLPERIPRVHLAVAMPKGERPKVLLDMCTQLGVASITPLHCARSIAKPSANSQRRWRKICLAACKQSGQAYLPAIRNVATPAAFAEDMGASSARVFVAHPGGATLTSWHRGSESVAVLVGPEGGFTDREIDGLRAKGAVEVSLGTGTLRVETAAVVAVGSLLVVGTSPR